MLETIEKADNLPLSPCAPQLKDSSLKRHGLSLSRFEWEAWALELKIPAFRARQISEWLGIKRGSHPNEMTNIPAALKNQMIEQFSWQLPQVVERIDADDGSSKLLLKSSRGFAIECVLMRYEKRISLCVSSQVGCRLACNFCQTGKMGFVSNLHSWEILAQYVIASQILKAEGNPKLISHVIFMGMGEPLDNFEATLGAANRLCDPDGYGLTPKNVTISTSGIAAKIPDLAALTKASLAISLHACRDDLRSELMPINNRYPLAALKEALMTYQKISDRIITIEYLMIKDKNISKREMKELVKFVHGLRVKVNLIPFNAHPGLMYERPDDESIREFQKYLSERSIPAPVRYSKGLEASGACGQLAAKTLTHLDEAPNRRNLNLNLKQKEIEGLN